MWTGVSWSHGIAGKRFYPTTLAIEDPAVSDEISFLFGRIKEPAEGDEPAVVSTEISGEFSKRITSKFAVSVGSEFLHLNPDEGKTENGFGNLELGAKYELLNSAVHEAILSFGLEVELEGTGSSRVGAESVSTISPAFFFGKGFGDLPDSLEFLRPMAFTAIMGFSIPTRSKEIFIHEEEVEIERHPAFFNWGGTIQYNLQYLQSYVKDVGLPVPLNRMIAIVEANLETCVNQGCSGETRGSVNPGIIWFGKSMQFGIEAVIPINSRSGNSVGILGLMHFFLDDIFPTTLGQPVFH
jgi:hypothetical protein